MLKVKMETILIIINIYVQFLNILIEKLNVKELDIKEQINLFKFLEECNGEIFGTICK
jgi:hypothetical protein